MLLGLSIALRCRRIPTFCAAKCGIFGLVSSLLGFLFGLIAR